MLCYRFVRTGALPMLKMMGGKPAGEHRDDRFSGDSPPVHRVTEEQK
jgi:hypothetical protein